MDEQLKEILFDDMVKFAVEKEFENQIKKIPSENELKEYAPSKEFDLKMQALIKKHYRKRNIGEYFNITKKVAAWVGIVTITGSIGLMTVEASRNYILNIFMEFKKGSADITVQDSSSKKDKANILYTPKYIPKGFSEGQTILLGKTTVILCYENTNGNEIRFRQSSLENANVLSVDTDGTEYSEIKINGNKANLFKAKTDNDLTNLVWVNKEFQFHLSCYGFDILDELIEMAKSIE